MLIGGWAQALKWGAIAAIVAALGYGILDYRKQAEENARNKQVIEQYEKRELKYEKALDTVNQYIKGIKEAEDVLRETQQFLNRVDVREIIEESENEEDVARRIRSASDKRLRELKQITEEFVNGQSEDVQQVQRNKSLERVSQRKEREVGPRK